MAGCTAVKRRAARRSRVLFAALAPLLYRAGLRTAPGWQILNNVKQRQLRVQTLRQRCRVGTRPHCDHRSLSGKRSLWHSWCTPNRIPASCQNQHEHWQSRLVARTRARCFPCKKPSSSTNSCGFPTCGRNRRSRLRTASSTGNKQQPCFKPNILTKETYPKPHALRYANQAFSAVICRITRICRYE